MSLWRITDFDLGPHPDTAIIEADTAEDACLALAAYLTDEDRRDDANVWEPQPLGNWQCDEITGPVVFALGAGCRS